jgi:ParB-like nuclease family protein
VISKWELVCQLCYTSWVKLHLTNEAEVSFDEVVASLASQKAGTKWAEKTNGLAIDYARHLREVYGDVWYKGLLPEELFLRVLLPQHGHLQEDKTGLVLFPDNTSTIKAREYYKKVDPEYTSDCIGLIKELKEKIKQDGFIESIVLVVINGELKHVDGLHRMVALSLLLEEGFVYKPIPVFLCASTRVLT